MPFKVADVGTTKRVVLDLPKDLDPDQDTYVVVRRATTGDDIERMDMSKGIRRVYKPGSDEVIIDTEWNMSKQQAFDVYLTLSDTNITDEEGKPFFPFARSQGVMRYHGTFTEFLLRWNKLPKAVSEAVIQAVYQVNPEWDPNR